MRLGNVTVWEQAHGYAEGAGQRDLKLTTADGGMTLVGLLQVAQIVFDEPDNARTDDPEPEPRKGFWSKLFG